MSSPSKRRGSSSKRKESAPSRETSVSSKSAKEPCTNRESNKTVSADDKVTYYSFFGAKCEMSLEEAQRRREEGKWYPGETLQEKEERLRLKDRDSGKLPAYIFENNKWLLTGYRVNYTYLESFKSIFAVHNETGNIWTHIIYFWLVVMCCYYAYMYLIHLEPEHYLVFTVFAACNLWVCFFSTMYHTLCNHEEEGVFRLSLLLDLTGIALLITASFIPGLWWGMACIPFWRNIYLAMILILGGGSIMTPIIDSEQKYISHTWRTLLFTLTAASGLLPSIHFLIFVPLGYGSTARLPLGGLALMFLQYGGGLLFYITKIPERWFPGHFDIWITSHQIWHIGVGNAMLCYFHCVIRMYETYKTVDTDVEAHC